MADLDSEFGFLAASAKRSIDLLRAYPEQTSIKADERGSALRGHIEYTLAGVESKLQDAAVNFPAATPSEQAEYVKRARLLNSLVRFMHRSVPWVSQAATPSLALGALYFIDELGERICGMRLDAVPNAADEYSTERWPFQPLFKDLGLAVQSGPRPVVLNFPRLESASHLLLPIYAHEVGHTAVWETAILQDVIDAHSSESAFSAAFNKARDDTAASAKISQREAGYILAWRLNAWTTEMLCDQCAIQALGPSYLYAFASFLLSESWDEPGERHPPTCVRVAHMLDYLAGSGWSASVETDIPAISSWLKDQVAATSAKQPDAATSFLLAAMHEMRPTIREHTAKQLGASVYLPSEFAPEASVISELTRYDTLPAQRHDGGPLDRRAIILSAWLSVLEADDQPATLANALGDVRTQAFFAKAIEMSALLAAWSQP